MSIAISTNIVTARSAMDIALEAFTNPKGDPVALFRGLVDAVRPLQSRDPEGAVLNWRAMNSALAASEVYRQAVAAKALELLTGRQLDLFLAEQGILPSTGFFSELYRKIVRKFLPELLDERVFKDCVDLVFHQGDDHYWFKTISTEDKHVFWCNLDLLRTADQTQVAALNEQLVAALVLVTHRAVALALDPELRRLHAEAKSFAAPGLALQHELAALTQRFRDRPADPDVSPEDEERIIHLIGPCREQLKAAYQVTAVRGVSLALTYILRQLEQHLDRIELLVGLLCVPFRKEPGARLLADMDHFTDTAIRCGNQRNNISAHVSELLGLLALRVTENASRTGEHYITSDWPGYRAMWLSAMGAGLIIPFMALMKIEVSLVPLPPVGYGIAYSMIYGLGFVLIALLHFTVATKQPAMTANRIAGAIHTTEGKVRDNETVVALILDTLRSQLAAVLGNILVAVGTALLVAWYFAEQRGYPLVDEEEANYLLDQLRPFGSLTLFYAAIAGVWLFMSGLIAGYFDNLTTYMRVGERVAHLRWLVGLAGRERAMRFGAFVDRNLGSLTGNFLFGCMLGMTGVVGVILGLPLNIRHIAFASANLAYALAGLNYEVPTSTVVDCSLGVALIGLTNLLVSFTLALYVALRSRGGTIGAVPGLLGHAVLRLVRQPLQLLVPPAGAVAKH
jgi:site-specific recombinase